MAPELRVDQLVTADPVAAAGFVADTLAAGHEGVVVKALDAPYEAGRRGAVAQGQAGPHAGPGRAGRRVGLGATTRVAVEPPPRRARADPDDPVDATDDDGRGFTMLGKTFKGLTDDTLTWQTEQLLAREVRREGHVVHVRPELVVEIALDGFVRSTRYAGGLAMRFARVRGYRPDRTSTDADTLATARAVATGERPPMG